MTSQATIGLEAPDRLLRGRRPASSRETGVGAFFRKVSVEEF